MINLFLFKLNWFGGIVRQEQSSSKDEAQAEWVRNNQVPVILGPKVVEQQA